MDILANLEITVAKWFKNIPHLPRGGQEWLADNIWWLALVVAIFGVIGLFTIVPVALITFGFTADFAGLAAVPYNTPFYWINIIYSLVSLLVMTILAAFAVAPLKAKATIGWRLLFISLIATTVLDLISNVVSLVLMGNAFGLSSFIGALVSAVVTFLLGAYFLTEIRGYFGIKHKPARKKATKAKA